MHTYYGVSRAGNGVAQVAAVNLGNSYFEVFRQVEQEAGKELVVVGSAEVNG